MDNMCTFVWLLIFVGLVAMGTGQRDDFCPSDGSIEDCNRQYLPTIHIGGRLVDQTKRVLFMEPLKLNKNEVEDICRHRQKYEEFLSCVNSLKLNCWINYEVQKLYIERPQINRVINYICQNYTNWRFLCAGPRLIDIETCQRDYIRNRTRHHLMVTTTRGPITDDNVDQFVRDQCLNVQGKEFCYERIFSHRCDYQTRTYGKYLLEVLRPYVCSANRLSCPIIAIVTFIWLSIWFSIG